MKLIISTIFSLSLLFLTACSSMMSGTTQSVKVDSTPSGAKVFIATKDKKTGVFGPRSEAGVTPIMVDISRKDGAIILEKEGYKPAEVALVKSMNSWMWGNVLLGSLLSTSIDTSTGASNEYDPGEYTVELSPENTTEK